MRCLAKGGNAVSFGSPGPLVCCCCTRDVINFNDMTALFTCSAADSDSLCAPSRSSRDLSPDTCRHNKCLREAEWMFRFCEADLPFGAGCVFQHAEPAGCSAAKQAQLLRAPQWLLGERQEEQRQREARGPPGCVGDVVSPEVTWRSA